MKHGRIVIPILLSFSLVLSAATMSARTFATKAESNDIDIQGIVGQYTMDETEFMPELYTINLATASILDSEIESNEEANLESATDGLVDVVARDWYKYSSAVPSQGMNTSEQEFYNRLAALSQYYMDTSTIDAYFVDAYNTYAINGVKYSDLGLSSKQAFYVAEWFLYNNPQYYFLKPTFLTTSYAIYLGCYDIAADGDDRAELTNEIFDEIDFMVDYIAMYATTPYETEQCIHDIVCGNLVYQSGTYDQSIYSAIMEGQTVCAGYSGMMNVLLNASGIDTITVLSSCHAWNQVFLDGEWYGVDATWNDSLGAYTYFNVSDANLKRYDSVSREHTYDSAFAAWVPNLSEYDYGTTGSYEEPQDVFVDVPELFVETVDESTGRVRWSAVSGATSYEISIYTDAAYSDLQVRQNTKNYSVKLSNMSEGQTYYFSVRAIVNQNGVDYYSDYAYGFYLCPAIEKPTEQEPIEEPVEPVTPPEEEPIDTPVFEIAAPVDLAMTLPTETTAKITWSAVDGALKYNVEVYRDEAMTNIMASANTAKTTMKLSGMVAGQTVYARVCSIAEHDGETYYSDYVTVAVKTLDAVIDDTSSVPEEPKTDETGKTDPVVPEQPSEPVTPPTEPENPVVDPVVEPKEIVIQTPSISVSDITISSAKFDWTTVADATSYDFQICNDAGYSSVIAKKETTKHKMSLSGLLENATYYVQVRAVAVIDGKTYTSDWARCEMTTVSNVITVTVPQNVSCEYVSDTASRLTWSGANSNTSYEVCIYGNESHTQKLGSMTTAKTSLKISGLVKGNTYYVSIRAVENINGENYYSEWVNVHLIK